jgi:hypothetical protein
MTWTGYPDAAVAKDKNGVKLKVGDWVTFGKGRKVKIVRMHKQGADGTILTTEPSPDAEYLHSKSGRASRAEKCAEPSAAAQAAQATKDEKYLAKLKLSWAKPAKDRAALHRALDAALDKRPVTDGALTITAILSALLAYYLSSKADNARNIESGYNLNNYKPEPRSF